jgi:hypothetical protein
MSVPAPVRVVLTRGAFWRSSGLLHQHREKGTTRLVWLFRQPLCLAAQGLLS